MFHFLTLTGPPFIKTSSDQNASVQPLRFITRLRITCILHIAYVTFASGQSCKSRLANFIRQEGRLRRYRLTRISNLYIQYWKWGLSILECHYLQTAVTLQVRLNNKAVGLGKPDKTPKKIGLLCAVLKEMSYSS